MSPKQRFYLKFDITMAPGDFLVTTAWLRDFKQTYGDQYEVFIDSKFQAIWRNNPYITPMDPKDPTVTRLKINYLEQLKAAQMGQRRHYLTAMYAVFEKATGLRTECRIPRPDLHLSEQEKSEPLISGRYWIIIPGGKKDTTNKYWHTHRYQEAVDLLHPWGVRFVEEGGVKALQEHPPLNNVLNVVGLTGQRDLMVNIYHAEGVLCGVSFPMHIAAAFDKPCVVVAGGREEPWWEAYTNAFKAFGPSAAPVVVSHQYLHTLGMLPCCERKGCWTRRVVPLKDRMVDYDKSLCYHPKHTPNLPPVPTCMDMIQTSHVTEAVMSYYEQAILPPLRSTVMQPIGSTKGTYEQPPAGRPELCPSCGASLQHFQPGNVDEPRLIRPTELQQAGEAHPTAVSPEICKPVCPSCKPSPVASPPKLNASWEQTFADPRIGGKITIFTLLYGPDIHFHRRCLSSILNTVPAEYLDLRVATNQVGADTNDFLATLPITKIYPDTGDRRKYPAMRSMFWDPDHPITTPWFCWFDDDTWVTAEGHNWLLYLCNTIIEKDDPTLGALGSPLYHPLQIRTNHDPRKWFLAAPWHRGRLFRTQQGGGAPNGTCIHFPVGWFWAMKTQAMRDCDIPDRRLNHNGGDATIGEQLYQGGYKICPFNLKKSLIACPDKPHGRRGFSERFPWYV